MQQIVAALGPILQRAVRRRLKIEFRNVERDVIVVRGAYHYTPRPGRKQNEIHLYGTLDDGERMDISSDRSFSEFLKRVGERIERPVVNEVTMPPERLMWHAYARVPATNEIRASIPAAQELQMRDHDEALVLKHLHEQTGLTFTREKKPVRILFVERAR